MADDKIKALVLLGGSLFLVGGAFCNRYLYQRRASSTTTNHKHQHTNEKTKRQRKVRHIGIVGYGKVGQALTHYILENGKELGLSLAFVWNRTKKTLYDDSSLPDEYILQNLEDVGMLEVDLIVEVAHPSILASYGALFLASADLMAGSPTAFADPEVEKSVRESCFTNGHTLYIPSGAFWGANDVKKMADLNTLKRVHITMKKHPLSLKVLPPLDASIKKYKLRQEAKSEPSSKGKEKVTEEDLETENEEGSGDEEWVLYDGSVRELCALAPQNVNTMACCAMAAHNLGFDAVRATLIADPKLSAHVIEIVVEGPGSGDNGDSEAGGDDDVLLYNRNCNKFCVSVRRFNPAKVGAVTGSATYDSFISSMLCACNQPPGVYFC
eukprot:CAMPEP_0174254840 /NCGR_PEP_ID=MMETSP0439-20130205/4186_1 /TAXON_ID=0 /ORGANISM="Stereomyxa ramosa, Strain Chinc5" /LENGTH=382 /DNA_ID=CAMNT_0015336701 /DNA_START=23 /DNA_END=1171 /DNA_ORIENTATION=-